MIEHVTDREHCTKDCLSCSASFSDDDESGKMILRCAEHNWKIVNENDCCEDWN